MFKGSVYKNYKGLYHNKNIMNQVEYCHQVCSEYMVKGIRCELDMNT